MRFQNLNAPTCPANIIISVFRHFVTAASLHIQGLSGPTCNMAWSLPFTGKRSIITDSYQRLALTVPVDRIEESGFLKATTELSKANLLHVSIVLPEGSWSGNKAGGVIKKLQTLSNLSQNIEEYFLPVPLGEEESKASAQPIHRPKRLFISLHVSHEAVAFAKALTTLNLALDMWIVYVSGDRPTALQNVLSIHEVVTTAALETSLGLGGCTEPMELDWFLCKIPAGVLKFVHLGDLHLPNLRVHCTELAHTLGYNTMFNVTSVILEKEIVNNAQLQEMAAVYGVPVDTFLLKCLLQLGCVAGIPLLEGQTVPYIAEHYSRLCHPFVHRKAFVSCNKVITLQVQNEHLSALTAASEAWEAQRDTFWMPHAQARSDNRTLTYTK